jgi:type IV secretory pathway TraG/TraD family ATPase VirD4
VILNRRQVVLAREDEASHFSLTGVPGAGKSTFIRQVLCQVKDRGHAAIVYDPHREFLPEFYDPSTDYVLNPLDARCPYWSPGDEVTSKFETLTLAESLFPERRNDQPFFASATRILMGRLLEFKPSAHQLAEWMRDQKALDRLVMDGHGRPTNAAESISRSAPEMRSGVIAEMNRIANTLMMVPEEKRTTTGRWSATEWARQRNSGGKVGWLFLTSMQETRAYTVPLTSLWLDTLVLRLMSGEPRAETVPVWFFFNEVATLQRLPQLKSAIAEGRKFNNPVVIDYQNMAQLKTLYGDEWVILAGMAKTRVIGRTTDPDTAKYLSEALGKAEIQRQSISVTNGERHSESTSLIREERPLVMPSELMGLPDRHMYLQTVDSVVPMVIPVIQLPKRCLGFVPREEPPAEDPTTLDDDVLVLDTPTVTAEGTHDYVP